MIAEKGNLSSISNNPSEELRPSWSPDGSCIAFQGDRDGNWVIYVMNVDCAERERMTKNEFKDSKPAWRPKVA